MALPDANKARPGTPSAPERDLHDHDGHAAHAHAPHDTFWHSDIASVAPFLAADAIAHEYRGTSHLATHHGRTAILERLKAVPPAYWDAFGVRLQTIALNGRFIATIGMWPPMSLATDQAYIAKHVLVARVEGHQVSEVWVIQDDLRRQ